MLQISIESKNTAFKKERFTFNQDKITIGKKIDSDIYIDDKHISRNHAVIEKTPKGWLIKDLQSTNGTYVEGKKIKTLPLLDHNMIQVGAFKILTQSMAKPSRKKNISERLQNSLSSSQAGMMDPKILKQRLSHKIEDLLKENKVNFSDKNKKDAYISNELQNILGLGFLEKYLMDPDITEIMLNGSNDFFIEKDGTIEKITEALPKEHQMKAIIDRIIAPLGRHVDEASPIVDARLSDGSRLNVVLPPISLNGPLLTIRKFKKTFTSLSALIQTHSITQDQAHRLAQLVIAKKNILISGGTSSGKTTLLNVLSNCIDPAERIITIEDSAELQLNQPHTISLEARPCNIEGAGEISIRRLVQNSLRMRPDRIIIGECRGAEAFDMLQAMNTGHDGSMTSCHSNGPREALKRIENMCLMAGYALPLSAIREQIASAIHYIIHMKRLSGGKRKITDIIKVCGVDQDTILTQSFLNSTKGEFDDN